MGNIYKRILKYFKLWPRKKFHKEILEHERHIKQMKILINKIDFERTKKFLEWEWCGKCKKNCFPELRKNFWEGETYEHYICKDFEWR